MEVEQEVGYRIDIIGGNDPPVMPILDLERDSSSIVNDNRNTFVDDLPIQLLSYVTNLPR
jgi:hypothetical protein